MKHPFKRRLSLRLTRNTVVLALTLGLFLNLIQVSLDYLRARENMDRDIRAITDISISPASQIAYNLDRRLAKELLQGLLTHPAIVEARVVDTDGRVLGQTDRPELESDYSWLSDRLFGPSRHYREALSVPQLGNTMLGYLDIQVDTLHYGLGFLKRASHTLISGFIKSLILSIILLFVFQRVLTRPLLRVINTIGQVESDSPEKTRLPIPPTHEEDEFGHLVHLLNNHLDVIDDSLRQVRAAEIRITQYSEQLEQEVEDRTREISEKNEALQEGNKALVYAKEEAMRRARSRADFLANMSHEIRTPLNGVLGMLELALDEELPDNQRERLSLARNAAQSLLDLLNDILDISKVESGKLNLESIEFNLADLIKESAALTRPQAQAKGLELNLTIDDALPRVFSGDPTRIRQIVNNLLNNALKFTDEGEIRIDVGMPNDLVQIDVTDTGIGMSTESQRKVFAAFAQGTEETTRRYGGTGLGLTLCRQLVESMGGQIELDSALGEGSRFRVFLPLPVRDGEDAIDTSDRQQEGPDRQGRILLVEDNQVNQLVADGILKKLDHEVTIANDGQQALEELETGTFDLVLMDCQMPVMDGFQAARKIRENPQWRHLPIIAVTANALEGDEKRCLDAGMNDFISKPYQRQSLEKVVQRWLADSSS